MAKITPHANNNNSSQSVETELTTKTTHKKLYIGLGIALIAAILILVMALFLWPKSTKPEEASMVPLSSTEPSQATTASTVPKLIIGNVDAKVSIVEYADFKCPLCGRFFRETEPQIKKDYIDKGLVNIEYRPLPIISKDSTVAALGAYCSNEQGKFGAYHDATFNYIYDNHYSKSLKDEFSNIFTLELLTQIASKQGMDTHAFNTCMTSNKYSKAIEQSEAEAKQDGASSTPTIIIGKQKISGAQPFAIYKPLIESQLR